MPSGSRDAYKAATKALSSALTSQRDAHVIIQRQHRAEIAGIRKRVTEAIAARDAAQRQAAASIARVDEVDNTATGLWRELLSYVGSTRIPPRLRDIDETPQRPAIGSGRTGGRGRPPRAPKVPEPQTLLERARKTLALAKRGQLEFPPPPHIAPLMALIGAACGFLAVLAATAILGAAGDGDGDKALALRPVALLVVFLGPFIGLPVASWFLGWRHRQRLRQHHVALVIGAGVVMLLVGVPLLML